MKQKIMFYKDELNDDFANSNYKEQDLSNYKYISNNNIGIKIFSCIVYRIIAIPIAFIYSKVMFDLKFKNKKKLKTHKNDCYYVYANHTHTILDALTPALSTIRKPYELVSSKNLSMPVLGKVLPMLGAIPVPNNRKSSIEFIKAIKEYEKLKHPIFIYPEAHVWPYYTKIRDFSDKSFKYPVKSKLPVYCYTTTYHKRKFSKRPKIIVYIDGPFYPNDKLNAKDAQKELRDKVYYKMLERSKESDVEYIKYIKKN